MKSIRLFARPQHRTTPKACTMKRFQAHPNVRRATCILALLLADLGCDRSPAEGQKTEEVAAVPDEAPAQPSTAESDACVRPGTYALTAAGPFYLLDESGKLPASAQRKQRTDDIHDCAAHARFDQTITVAQAGDQPEVTLSPATNAELAVEGVELSGCRLSFRLKNEGQSRELDRASVQLDFSSEELTAKATDVAFQIQLDGDVGENIVACGTDAIDLEAAPVQPPATCGVGGTPLTGDWSTCKTGGVVGGKCCYETAEQACAGYCNATGCSLMKSNPPQTICPD